MKVILILFLMAMMAHAQRGGEQPSRQRRSHLSLRQEQHEQQQQQGDASFLTEMMEIEAEVSLLLFLEHSLDQLDSFH
jgi:hypothetical protein